MCVCISSSFYKIFMSLLQLMLSVYVMGVVVIFSNQKNIFIVIVFQKFATQINGKVKILWKEGPSKKDLEESSLFLQALLNAL